MEFFPENSHFLLIQVSGGFSGGGTPVPIPNTEVKLSSADDTARVTVWESRSLPDYMPLRWKNTLRGFCFFCTYPYNSMKLKVIDQFSAALTQ